MPDCRMLSLPVVVNLDIFKDCCFCGSSAAVTVAMNLFDLQRVKEALHHRVIVTIRPTTHAAPQLLVLDQLLVGRCAVLAASIRVEDGAFGKTPPPAV